MGSKTTWKGLLKSQTVYGWKRSIKYYTLPSDPFPLSISKHHIKFFLLQTLGRSNLLKNASYTL